MNKIVTSESDNQLRELETVFLKFAEKLVSYFHNINQQDSHAQQGFNALYKVEIEASSIDRRQSVITTSITISLKVATVLDRDCRLSFTVHKSETGVFSGDVSITKGQITNTYEFPIPTNDCNIISLFSKQAQSVQAEPDFRNEISQTIEFFNSQINQY